MRAKELEKELLNLGFIRENRAKHYVFRRGVLYASLHKGSKLGSHVVASVRSVIGKAKREDKEAAREGLA